MSIVVKVQETPDMSFDIMFQSGNRFQSMNVKRVSTKEDVAKSLHMLAENILHDDLFE